MEIKKQEELRQQIENPRALYRIKQPFHQMGNQINFSSTRFHNVVIVRHEDELTEFISAQEKAIKEEKKVEQKKEMLKMKKEEFNKKTEENSLKLLKKNQAEDNVKKLNEELKKLNEARKKNKVKET
jgi:hypothetical protein